MIDARSTSCYCRQCCHLRLLTTLHCACGQAACDKQGPRWYPELKRSADEYFLIRTRGWRRYETLGTSRRLCDGSRLLCEPRDVVRVAVALEERSSSTSTTRKWRGRSNFSTTVRFVNLNPPLSVAVGVAVVVGIVVAVAGAGAGAGAGAVVGAVASAVAGAECSLCLCSMPSCPPTLASC